uniref:Integrase catalytic domain-containing protein n=1 Tax=Codium arenicola TaxID=1191365 RepID=A0A2P0QHY4_9CHLO|nr:hypothetical protein [Codium arenicola]ARO74342.1 hypothetical protein [Codium arenicola]
MFVVIDLANGECLAAKAFNESNNRYINERGISSLYLVKFMKCIIEQKYVPIIDHKLIIHSDQGPEFRSDNWAKLEDLNVQLSMTTYPNSTQENAVCERFQRTLKTLLKLKQFKPTIPKQVKNLAQLNLILSKRINNINLNHLNKRDKQQGASVFRQKFLKGIQTNQIHKQTLKQPLAFDSKYIPDSNFKSVDQFKNQIAQSETSTQIYSKTDQILDKINKVCDQNHLLALKNDEMQQTIDRVDRNMKKVGNKLIKKKRKIRKTVPKRTGINFTIFDILMQVPRLPGYSQINHFRFILTSVLFFATGLRSSDICRLTFTNFQELCNDAATRIFSLKTQSSFVVTIAPKAQTLLNKYHSLAQMIFAINADNPKLHNQNQEVTLNHTQHFKTFNQWYNTHLKAKCQFAYEEFKKAGMQPELMHILSHSFRIGRVGRFMQANCHIDLKFVSTRIGHKSVSTTEKYIRLDPLDPTLLQTMNNIEDQAFE